MRLITTILFIAAAVCWTPWLFLLVRLAIDLASGTGWNDSLYVTPTLGLLVPEPSLGFWPPWRWFAWDVASAWPWGALAGIVLSAAGWRLYWLNEDGVLTRPGWLVGLSVIAPLLSPFLMWGDAKKRHHAKEEFLEDEVQDAKHRLAH